MAARLLAAARVSGAPEQVTALLAAGAVGPGAAAEFLAWREDLDLPDPETVLSDPGSFRLPDRGDRAYAALAAVTAAVIANNTADRWEAAWQAIAAATGQSQSDIAVAAVRSLIAHRPDGAIPPRRRAHHDDSGAAHGWLVRETDRWACQALSRSTIRGWRLPGCGRPKPSLSWPWRCTR